MYIGDKALEENHPQLLPLVSVAGWNLSNKIWTDDVVIEKWGTYKRKLNKSSN